MKGILLTVDPNQIISYILGIIIIIAGTIMVVRYLKTKKGKEEVDAFLNEIETAVREEILQALTKIDLKQIMQKTGTLMDAEAELISNLYDKVWDLVQKHLDEIYAGNSLYIIMKANLTKDFIMDFAKIIVQSKPVQNMISNKLEAACNSEDGDELEKEYEELNKKVEDDTLAEGEEIPEINLEEAMPDLEPIIPPSDESPDIDEDVDEVVGEKQEEVSLDQLSRAMVDGEE